MHILEDLVEKLSQLSVMDMAKLKKALEEKWGVKAAVAAAACCRSSSRCCRCSFGVN